MLTSAAQAAEMTEQDLSQLADYDVILLGEVHDNPDHHAFQARAVEAIGPAALVFEMLSPEQAATITSDLRSDPAALELALDWDTSGWPDFAMYAPLFAATDAPVYGADIPRSEVRRAMSDGAAAVFGPEADRFGLATALPEAEQAAREADQMASHCNALPPEMLPGMVAAQRLRDAAFARTILEAHRETGGPVVMITGTGHADRDRGIPAALQVAAPQLRVAAIGAFETDAPADAPFDFWITAPPAEREDPCAVFAKDG